MHPAGILSSVSLHACLHGAATLHVGSPNLPAADFALELGAAFELEVVGANSTTLGLIHPRACYRYSDVTLQNLECADPAPPTDKGQLESEPIWQRGQVIVEWSQRSSNPKHSAFLF